MVVFNPLRRLYPQWAPRRRDHRKILVVDGEVGFTGGLNIGDEYLEGPGPRGGEPVPWRDAHVRVVGPAVQLLEARGDLEAVIERYVSERDGHRP